MVTFQEIRQQAQFVAENSDFVSISEAKLAAFAAQITPANLAHWMNEAVLLPPRLDFSQELMFTFLFDLSSFCYWPKPKWRRIVNNQMLGGSYSLVACYGEAIQNGLNLLNPEVLLNLTFEDYCNILKGDTGAELTMLRERYNFIRSAVKVLQEKYSGQLEVFVEHYDQDAEKLLNAFISEFAGFADVSPYKGRQIPFLKRAQLSISDINAAYQRHRGCSLKNIELLTACADYKLPQILRAFEVLLYQPELARLVDEGCEIPASDPMEVEIRANTIYAVQLLTRQFNRLNPGKRCTDMQMNDYIWRMSQGTVPGTKNHHFTRTCCY